MEKQLFCCRPDGESCDLNKIKKVVNEVHVKPKGGLWTSTYTPDEDFCSDWVYWCASDMPSWLSDKCVLMKPKKDAKIFTIDTYKDLEKLNSKYALQTDKNIWGTYLDWEKISKDYDGVRLTACGQGATRLTHPLNLYGWDCESTLWFRNVFEAVEDLPSKEKRKCLVGKEAKEKYRRYWE